MGKQVVSFYKMDTTKIYIFTCFIILLFFSELHAQGNQNKLCLEDVLAFTQTDSFAINSLLKIVIENLSGQENINIKIEGAISDPDFSFAIISMIPSLRKRIRNNSTLELAFYPTNEKDFNEILIIDAIAALYPSKYFDYLIDRAKYNFSESWERAVRSMGIDVNRIKTFILDSKNIPKAKNKLSSKLNDEYKIVVNGMEIRLIEEFYKGLNDDRFEFNCGTFNKCFTDCIFVYSHFYASSPAVTEEQVYENWQIFSFDPNEVYFKYLNCLGGYFDKIYKEENNSFEFINTEMNVNKLIDCTNKGKKATYRIEFCKDRCIQNADFINKIGDGSINDKRPFVYKGEQDCVRNKQVEWGTINSK